MGGIIIGLLLLDSRFGGRRMQLMAVTATAIPLTLLIGLSAEFSWPNAVSLVVICAFAFDWQLAWGMIPWVYPSELFSMSERDRATSLAVLVQYLANALLMVVEPKLESWFGHAGLFYFFAAFKLKSYHKDCNSLPQIPSCLSEVCLGFRWDRVPTPGPTFEDITQSTRVELRNRGRQSA